jgi:hypothetical protein
MRGAQALGMFVVTCAQRVVLTHTGCGVLTHTTVQRVVLTHTDCVGLRSLTWLDLSGCGTMGVRSA